MDKIHVILDTDTYNECDDQFALTYLIKHQDIFDIDAITTAPYSHHTIYISAPDSQELSYNEARKICKYFGFDEDKVFKGSTNYLQCGYSDDNDAVNKIIEIANKNDKTCILGIAAPTNIALAIKKDPSIVDKIEIVWLGGNALDYENNTEYNFRQDLDAVRTMFNSGVALTVLPAKGVVSKLNININVLKENIGNIDKMYDYLIERFHDDGYHPIREERPIWDISVIAYMVNKNWFEEKTISCPEIQDDMSYQFTKKRNEVTFITDLDKDKIYDDLFTRYKM